MSSFNIVELNVVRWGEERGIIQNSTSAAQVTKTQEEVDRGIGGSNCRPMIKKVSSMLLAMSW
jgi:hypothetical protein